MFTDVTCDVDAIAAQNVQGVHTQILAREIKEAHVKIDLELYSTKW